MTMNILKLITPANLLEEQERFFNSKTYHPIFKYSWNVEQINEWVATKPNYRYLVSSILNQDNINMTKEAEKIFISPWDEKVYELALSSLKYLHPNVYKPTLNDLVRSQENFLQSLGIDYRVEVIDAHGFVARPNHKEKKLQISKQVEYYYFSMESSVRHDGVHIIRYLNGNKNNIKRSNNYLPTEEGLATFMQDFGGKEPNNSLFQHAAEYSVTKVCKNGTLREAIEYLQTIGFPSKLAWQRAVRHKFGFINTSMPGDIMKPSMYFYNSQKIKDLSNDQRLKLFLGKISTEELQNYDDYNGIWGKEKLNEVFGGLV